MTSDQVIWQVIMVLTPLVGISVNSVALMALVQTNSCPLDTDLHVDTMLLCMMYFALYALLYIAACKSLETGTPIFTCSQNQHSTRHCLVATVALAACFTWLQQCVSLGNAPVRVCVAAPGDWSLRLWAWSASLQGPVTFFATPLLLMHASKQHTQAI